MADALSRLQSLTRIAIDSANGYEAAAETARTQQLKTILTDAGTKRRRLVERLNAEIVRLGGERETSGSAAGSVHRAWTRLADAFGDGDERATERVEEGEDYIEQTFREALDEDSFDPETRALLRELHAELQQGERMTDALEKQYD